MQNIGELIRTLRKKEGYPLRKVAAFLDIDQAVLSKIERGQRKLTKEQVIKLADFFNYDEKEMLITYQDNALTATQYIIQPYANDEKSARYGAHANKYYIFTLSDGIPGTIYEIRSIVPKAKTWQQGDELITDERLTFTGFKPKPVH